MPQSDDELKKQFAADFKEKILNNKEVMKKITKRVMPYFKIPTGSDTVKQSLARELAEEFLAAFDMKDDGAVD